MIFLLNLQILFISSVLAVSYLSPILNFLLTSNMCFMQKNEKMPACESAGAGTVPARAALAAEVQFSALEAGHPRSRRGQGCPSEAMVGHVSQARPQLCRWLSTLCVCTSSLCICVSKLPL